MDLWIIRVEGYSCACLPGHLVTKHTWMIVFQRLFNCISCVISEILLGQSFSQIMKVESSQREVCCEHKRANNAEGMLLINAAM